jgi:hypothetical protein
MTSTASRSLEVTPTSLSVRGPRVAWSRVASWMPAPPSFWLRRAGRRGRRPLKPAAVGRKRWLAVRLGPPVRTEPARRSLLHRFAAGQGARRIGQYQCRDVGPRKPGVVVRGHWSVENGQHFLKDRWWDEDRQWSVRPGLAERLAMLRDAAVTALRLIPGRARRPADPGPRRSPGAEAPRGPPVHRGKELTTLQSSWLLAGGDGQAGLVRLQSPI